jgi:predicted CoA-substrate-specific enzyme activase
MIVYLGIDIGSVTLKLALLTGEGELIAHKYLRIQGRSIAALQQGLAEIRRQLPSDSEVRGVGVTGSARNLAGAIVGADVVKNEITAQAVGALRYFPHAHTIIEIGGQDSKFIVIRDGMVIDFAMNTVCAAGTGSFLDQQASRLAIKIEDVGEHSLQSKRPAHISSTCTVFAESDIIHKQQMGYRVEDMLYGLCQSLVRNYLNDVVRGKEVCPPILFQGGVAFNGGIIRAFEESLKDEIIVPRHHEMMGAIGAALLARENVSGNGNGTAFRGFGIGDADFNTSSFECSACSKVCEIAQVIMDREIVACFGGHCDLWEGRKIGQTETV